MPNLLKITTQGRNCTESENRHEAMQKYDIYKMLYHSKL